VVGYFILDDVSGIRRVVQKRKLLYVF